MNASAKEQKLDIRVLEYSRSSFSFSRSSSQTTPDGLAPVSSHHDSLSPPPASTPFPIIPLRIFIALPRSPRRDAVWTSLNCHGATDPFPRGPRPRVTATVLQFTRGEGGGERGKGGEGISRHNCERRRVPRSMGQYARTVRWYRYT